MHPQRSAEIDPRRGRGAHDHSFPTDSTSAATARPRRDDPPPKRLSSWTRDVPGPRATGRRSPPTSRARTRRRRSRWTPRPRSAPRRCESDGRFGAPGRGTSALGVPIAASSANRRGPRPADREVTGGQKGRHLPLIADQAVVETAVGRGLRSEAEVVGLGPDGGKVAIACHVVRSRDRFSTSRTWQARASRR